MSQAQQAQPLLAEGEYQENISFLAHQHLQAQKQVARLAQHAQRLEAANESLSKQLKESQEELAKLKQPAEPSAEPLPPIEPPAAEPAPEPVDDTPIT